MSDSPFPPPPPPADQNSNASPIFRQKKSRFSFLPKLSKSSSPTKVNHEANEPSNHPTSELLSSPSIILDDSASVKEADIYTDRYEWAVLYENQRGMTLFSVAYYSRLSLLPTDPSPFTSPNASRKRSKQPSVSLSQYPLPDGTWRWISRDWMIDMRSDGEVDPVGYEYNWSFRTHNWRANIGKLSAGGWVRRRRWIRLMMRPAMQSHIQEHDQDSMLPSAHKRSNDFSRHRQSLPSSFSPSSPFEYYIPEVDIQPDQVWQGDDVDLIWERLRILMRHLGRDGRKLEMWREWLRQDTTQTGKEKRKQWTEDDEPTPSATTTSSDIEDPSFIPPIEVVGAVLRKHYKDVLDFFVFPDTRAHFIELLGSTKALSEVIPESLSGTEVNFWSYGPGGSNHM